MRNQNTLFVVLGVAVIGYLYTQRQSVSDLASTVGDTVTAAITGWKSVGSAPNWLPYLNNAEATYGLPQDLLARMAYQESRFREEIIRGTKASPVGALGILQMMPQYFVTVGNPRPYTDASVLAQIDEAAQQVQSLYHSTGDWSLTLAAYNAGLGNVKKYGGIPPFTETKNYVAQITADVPALGLA